MGIDSYGNSGHSHSHTGCFPFLPIHIPNFVTNSHYYGNPMGFPFPLGIPFPWSSLVRMDYVDLAIRETVHWHDSGVITDRHELTAVGRCLHWTRPMNAATISNVSLLILWLADQSATPCRLQLQQLCTWKRFVERHPLWRRTGIRTRRLSSSSNIRHYITLFWLP